MSKTARKNTPPKKKNVKAKKSPKAIKHRMNYTREQMEKAIEEVKNGMTCSNASKKYGVPRVTIVQSIR